ncbi:MAG: 50S ribosomal protein L29 [Candidatus Uhrbacteria bacterium GW2011_GWE2_45_35]|uniref:Large ribosomal subunit protein uL29 n=2 Tax=Candidatus Uhriibacteriota TaxID=1752732 RepID=A0A0G1MJ29_9BACT|nr:MAG: 50S ribosomal protein L29 [Candidatus Uhrbacteria bacterium GW2011_GWF2_44_350]KKU09235.1 MAG: 50S ribosomal protein L29 [Candidatus Uhrbacteria bacterium GW2011_GWE2_45_35]HBR80482.1 50S ribosomal protein L29 [Candidatus Uhrbacteria bacterium]HCU31533.1 50S ribosomal protein L29 [Candidatus Uhrbacteria bacterium]
MDEKEIKNASLEALKKMLAEAESELRSMYSALSVHQLSQVRKVREVKKRIARIKTFLRQKTTV